MRLCLNCEKIKDIRIRKEKNYYYDLCEKCRRKEIIYIFSKMKRRISSL